MTMNTICVTGFFASGSSAVIDYLSEFDTTCLFNEGKDYEHSLFYVGDGLFELYDRLFSDRTNYISRSHALNQFCDMCIRQYHNDFGWFGSYKRLIGKPFLDSLNDFVSSISGEDGKTADIADYQGVHFSLLKGLLQIGAHIVYGYKITKFGRQYKKSDRPFRYVTCSQELFIEKCKLFLSRYSELCNNKNKQIVVFDHLVSAEQVWGTDMFLPEDYKIILVDRNPVDSYLLSKYVWNDKKHYYHPPVPLDSIRDFCNHYIFQRRNIEKIRNMRNVYYVRFEELVVNYNAIVSEINDFCGLDSVSHALPRQKFNPEISINNINVDRLYPDEKENLEYIRNNVPLNMYSIIETNKINSRKSIF